MCVGGGGGRGSTTYCTMTTRTIEAPGQNDSAENSILTRDSILSQYKWTKKNNRLNFNSRFDPVAVQVDQKEQSFESLHHGCSQQSRTDLA